MANAHAASLDDPDLASLAAMERKAKAATPATYDSKPVGPQKVVVEHVVKVNQWDVAIGVCFGLIAFSIVAFLFRFLVEAMFSAPSGW